MGQLAIKLEKASKKCVGVLQKCLATKVPYVVQEAIVVMRDVFRKYPQTFSAILKDLFMNLKTYDEPEAKAAMIWMIGEYAETFVNTEQILRSFVDTFQDEAPQVQLQILSSCVKQFLRDSKKQSVHQMIQKLLKLATEENDNPDLRDRAYIYWRLLAKYPETAKKIVFAERPPITEQSYQMETSKLDKLIANIGSLSSIYSWPPELFVQKLRESKNRRDREQQEESSDENTDVDEGAELNIGGEQFVGME